MSDYESQSELDDELLSAYLDDELSPEERAAVEARLAADPSAQQLLHQLRSISESVQAMPQEVVGHDMRDAIIQRAEQASRGASAATLRLVGDQRDASNGQPETSAEATPKLTIGRTRRGWVWATLAIAAALLIMAFQREPGADDLPAVAQIEDRPAAQRGRFRDLELRAPSRPAAPAVASEPASAPPAHESLNIATTDLDEALAPTSGLAVEPAPSALGTQAAPELSLQAGVNQPADNSAAQGFGAYAADGAEMKRTGEPPAEDGASMPAVDHLSAAPSQAAAAGELSDIAQTQQFGVAAAGGQTAAPADEEAAALVAEDPLVIVRVLARQTALERKTFDQLLERNGIEVEPEAGDSVELAPQQARRSASRYAENGQTSEAAALSVAQLAEAATVDAVLVEAPSAAITACLSGLNQDEENFLGVEVDAAAATETNVAADSSSNAKLWAKQKLTEDLGLTKFNRGTVPEKNESITRDKDNFYRLDRGYYYGGGLGGYAGQERSLQLGQQERLSRARKNVTEPNKGLAVRLKDGSRDERAPQQQAARGGVTPEDRARPAARRLAEVRSERETLEQLEQLSEDRLQVLFLISSDAGAVPSTPAQNKAQ